MNKQQAKELLERYNSGERSAKERLQLEMWYMEQARNSDFKLSESELEDSVNFLRDRLPLVKSTTRRLWPRIAAAASFILVVGTALYFYSDSRKEQAVTEAFANDIAPGKNGATLTLANGQKILIKDALTGNIANQSGVKISKTADGQIIYEVLSSSAQDAEHQMPIAYNTLSTTRGEQTQVRLPDGTLVFLNAESSLRYPTSFAKLDKRQVSLTGEGYFEVAKDKAHPFVVNSQNQNVEVLGTHFNINSYSNEASVRTTLLEGSVAVSSLRGMQQSQTIKPGEQSIITKGQIKIQHINADNVVAWKNGNFLFEDEPLSSIMRKIERWYDVEVVYNKDVNKEELYWGGVSRYDNVSKVLRKLTLTGNIHFKIEGRRVTVMK